MQTMSERLLAKGKQFPEPDKDGFISYEKYENAGLPMVVSCSNCTKTMALLPNTRITDDGHIWCDDCIADVMRTATKAIL